MVPPVMLGSGRIKVVCSLDADLPDLARRYGCKDVQRNVSHLHRTTRGAGTLLINISIVAISIIAIYIIMVSILSSLSLPISLASTQ